MEMDLNRLYERAAENLKKYKDDMNMSLFYCAVCAELLHRMLNKQGASSF